VTVGELKMFQIFTKLQMEEKENYDVQVSVQLFSYS
jgi:hypothetical protein